MNYNIIPTLRTDKKDANGNAPIYIFIYEGSRQVMKISLKRKVQVANWNAEARRVTKKEPNAMLINSNIEKTIREISAKLLEEQLRGGPVDIADVLKTERKQDADFFAFAEEQIKLKNYAPETRRNYTVYLEKIKAFRPSLRVSQIDFNFLRSYESHLRDKLKNSDNTVWGNFKFINTITNDAIKAKVLVDDPFKVFKRVSYKQTVRTFLTAEELTRIEAFSLNADDRLKIVANYFLFSCYTGLRYSDAVRFQIDKHVVNDERIVMKTQKTGKETNLFINDMIRPLMVYVDQNRLKISQEDFNRRLKEIAAACGIKKKLSSHVARHSFGSSLVDLGIPIEVAKGLLSHGSTSSTKIYYHLKSTNLDEAMKKFNNKKPGA